MFANFKELFLYFTKAVKIFFTKFFLSVIACIIYFLVSFTTGKVYDLGISNIVSGIADNVGNNVSMIDLFSYNPVGVLLTFILSISTWLVMHSSFEIFAYFTITSKSGISGLGKCKELLKKKLSLLIKANLLKAIYVAGAFIPYLIFICLNFFFSDTDKPEIEFFLKISQQLMMIPGIYVMLQYYASSYFILSKNIIAPEALRESRRITYGYKMSICLIIASLGLGMGLVTFAILPYKQYMPDSVGIFLIYSMQIMVAVIGYFTMFVFGMGRDK